MKPKKPRQKPGPKRDPEISKLAEELAVTRQRAAAIKRQGGGTDEIRRLRARKLELEIEKLETEIKKIKGGLVPKADVIEAGRQLGAMISAELARMTGDLPPRLEGLHALRICEVLRAEFGKAHDNFHGQLASKIK